jgi:hypothetical protein
MRSTWIIIGLAGTLALTGCTESPLPVDGVSRPVASTSGALPSMPAEATEAPSAPASEAADAGITVVERACQALADSSPRAPTSDWVDTLQTSGAAVSGAGLDPSWSDFESSLAFVAQEAPPTDDWAPDKVNSFFDAYGVVAAGCDRVGVSIGAE